MTPASLSRAIELAKQRRSNWRRQVGYAEAGLAERIRLRARCPDLATRYERELPRLRAKLAEAEAEVARLEGEVPRCHHCNQVLP